MKINRYYPENQRKKPYTSSSESFDSLDRRYDRDGSEHLAWFLRREKKIAQFSQRRSSGEIIITSISLIDHQNRPKQLNANTYKLFFDRLKEKNN